MVGVTGQNRCTRRDKCNEVQDHDNSIKVTRFVQRRCPSLNLFKPLSARMRRPSMRCASYSVATAKRRRAADSIPPLLSPDWLTQPASAWWGFTTSDNLRSAYRRISYRRGIRAGFMELVGPLWRTLWKTLTMIFSVVSYVMKIMSYIRCYLNETTMVMNCDADAMSVLLPPPMINAILYTDSYINIFTNFPTCPLSIV